MHRGRRCLFFWYPSKDFPANQKDPRDGQWRCCCCWYTHAHARPDISLHPKSCILFCYGSSFTKRDLLFFFSRAELSWSLNIKVRSSPAPCIIAHFILLSFFPLPWYHHTHQQEAVLQPPSEISLLLGRTIHITTTVYSTGYIILQLGVHTVAKIWNKESNQPREVTKCLLLII